MPELIQGPDERVLVWIADHLRCAFLDPVMKFYTQLGNVGLVFIGVALILLCFKQTRRAGASALCAMLLGMIAVNLTIKPLVSRARPWVVMEGFTALVAEHDPNSFPSGHTNAAFAFGAALCASLPQKWVKAAALCAAALMGFSRLYVGVHFPSDVLVGAVIGTLCGLLGAWLVKWVVLWYGHRKEIE